jgi:hypothetical protein
MGVEENKSAVAEAIETFNDPDARREYLEIHDSSVSAYGLGSADPVDFTFGVQNIYRFRDGKVVARWSNPDLLGLMVQIGAIPAPG